LVEDWLPELKGLKLGLDYYCWPYVAERVPLLEAAYSSLASDGEFLILDPLPLTFVEGRQADPAPLHEALAQDLPKIFEDRRSHSNTSIAVRCDPETPTLTLAFTQSTLDESPGARPDLGFIVPTVTYRDQNRPQDTLASVAT